MKHMIKISRFVFFIAGPLSFITSASGLDLSVSQRQLTSLELFNRCYTHLTQLRLANRHPLRASVAAGTLTPVDACMKVLAEANLNGSGTIANTTTVNGANESLAVLRSFSEFHHTITQIPRLEENLPNSSNVRSTRIVYDEGEFGLHFTRALFTPGVQVSDIVKFNTGMEAIRSMGSTPSFISYAQEDVAGVTYNIPTTQTGSFLGVRPISANPAKANLSVAFSDKTFPVHKSDGGGVIGTPAYLLANFGMPNFDLITGGVKMPRRWSRAIYQDVLCRNLPVLRQADAAAFVQPVGPSTPPFRNSATCMACHASMDPMASTARNMSLYWDYYKPRVSNAHHIYRYPVTQPAETGIVDIDYDFYNRPPNGRLRFRSYDGTLNDVPVSSIADLGAQIANTNDFYACTAARYYKFFTGITVNLQDIGDPSQPTLTTGDLFYRNIVIKMGQNLKTSQNLPSLIREILSSDAYQRAANRGTQ